MTMTSLSHKQCVNEQNSHSQYIYLVQTLIDDRAIPYRYKREHESALRSSDRTVFGRGSGE